MTVHQARQQLLLQLLELYDDSESGNIADWVIEYITGQRKMDRITKHELSLSESQVKLLSVITQKLLQNTPVQYALNECWFAGMKFYVDANVLIPRPETEELVEWIIKDVKSQMPDARTFLDIGTGSGCIPIAIKKNLPKLNVKAIDVSEGALNVAIKNAMFQAVQVYFIRMNFLEQSSRNQLGKFDIIVSNPPYVKQSESAGMQKNVLDHEPHLALFVPDEDALLFYRDIADFGNTHLEVNGAIFLEINETLGSAVIELLAKEGYKTELRMDLQGKDRMLKAVKA